MKVVKFLEKFYRFGIWHHFFLLFYTFEFKSRLWSVAGLLAFEKIHLHPQTWKGVETGDASTNASLYHS